MRTGNCLAAGLLIFSVSLHASESRVVAAPSLTPVSAKSVVAANNKKAAKLTKTSAAKKSPAPKKTAVRPAKKSAKARKVAASTTDLSAPGQTLPGGIGDSVRASPSDELSRPQIEKAQRKAAVPPTGAGEMKVTLKRFEFKGNSLFTDEELGALIADYLNRPITLAEIYAAGDKVGDFYVLKGYSLAVVTVPAQKIAGGKVIFQVLEGVIGKLETEDNTVYSTEHILDYLDAFKSGDIYRAEPLEYALQSLNALPGLQTKAVIKPGEDPGSSDVTIKVQEKRFGATLGFDNYGRANTGALRGTFAAQMNNPFGLADQLQFVTLRSGNGRLEYYSGAYNLKPFVHGPRFGISYGAATFNVAGATGISRNGRANLDFSLFNSRAEKLNLGVGASRIISSVNLAGVPQAVTSITTYDLSASYNRLDESGGVTAAVLSLATNFDGNSTADCTLGAGNRCRNQAVKLDLGVQRLQPLIPGFDALIRLNAAYSPQPLPDNQQFSAGGAGNVRAFRSAEIRGDQGFVSSVDFRYGLPLGPVAATVRLFSDYAQVGTVDSGARGTMAHDSLWDYGLGFDFGYTEHFTAKVDIARPLATGFTAADGVRSDTRAYASASFNY